MCFEGKEVPYYDVKKGVGRILRIKDFPSISVDTPVYHLINQNDIDLFFIGQKVNVKIDVERRIRTTVHHSALHLALMYACDCRPDLMKKIVGCRITTEYGRLDFSLAERFNTDEINYINEKLHEISKKDIPILTYHHDEENEAWYWKCQEFICPCGGTHVQNTDQIGNVSVRRKNIGKNKERLIVVSECDCFSKELYHN